MPASSAIMAGMAYIKLTAKDAELTKALEGAQNKLKAFAKTVENVGAKMAVFGTLASAPFVAATKVFANFDDQMRMVGAVTGATGADFDMLTEKAKKLGRETSFTAAQVAEGMIALGRMGFSSKEIDAAIQPMMNLAKATGTDLAQAAEIAANNLRVFRMDASQTGTMADLLSATANNSAQTLGDLGEALKMAGPQAAAAGEDIKDVCAALGIMANMGIKGSMAGTALRKAYSQFADPKVQDFLKQYNITTVDANGNLRKMETIIYDIAGAMSKMGSAEKLAFAQDVFDMRGAMAGLSLTADTSAIDAFKQKLNEANGTAQQTADQMEQGIGGALRRLASAFEGVSIAIGEMLTRSVLPMAESFAQALVAVAEWARQNGGLITSIAGIAASAAVLGTVIKGVTIAGRGLVSAFSPLTALLKTLDSLATGTRSAAAAAQQQAAIAAATEQQKTLAAQTSAAKRAEADAARHAAEMQHAAQEAAAVAAAEKAKMAAITANQGAAQKQMAESTQKVAAIQAEAAAAVAAEKAKLAAARETGTVKAQELAQINSRIAAIQSEATAQVAAEQLKQTGIRQTTATLQAQAAAQKAVLATAEANAAAANIAASQSTGAYKAAAAATATATAAETAFMKSQGASVLIMARKQKIVGGLIASKLSYAVTSKTVGSVIQATNIKTLATEMAVAKGIKGVTVALYLKAVAAKVAAGAMGILRAAMTAIAAHPVTAALVAMVAVLTAISAITTKVNQKYREAAEAAKQFNEQASQKVDQGDQGRQNADKDFERLKQLEELSARGRLTAEEIAETERLLKALQPYGAAHYAQLDKQTGQLKLAADAQRKFNEAMREAAIAELEGKMRAAQDELDALMNENERLTSYWNHTLWKQMTGGSAEAIAQMEKNSARMSQINAQRIADHKRLKAMKEDDKNAVMGKEEEGSGSKVEEENQRRAASAQELAEAEKTLARIEEENAQKKLSAFEKEIQAIEKVRQEYLKNIEIKKQEEEALLTAAKKRAEQNKGQQSEAEAKAYAAAMAEVEKHAKNIAELNARQQAATADFDAQRRKAQEKEEARIAKNNNPYISFLSDQQRQEKEREQRRQQDSRFEALLKQSQTGDNSGINQFMSSLQAEIEKARQEYVKAVEDAQKEDSQNGKEISEEEKATLNQIQTALKSRQQQLEGYKEQIRNAAEKATSDSGTKAASTKQMAAFDAAALTALFDRSGKAQLSQEERVARATEESARYSKQIARNTAGGFGNNVQIG